MSGQLNRSRCARARELSALAPDGLLSEIERRSLRRHLTRCAQCARFSQSMHAAAVAVADAPEEAFSVDVDAVVLAAAATSSRGGTAASNRRRRAIRRPTVATASAVLAAAAMAVIATHLTTERQNAKTTPGLIIVDVADSSADFRDEVRRLKNRGIDPDTVRTQRYPLGQEL